MERIRQKKETYRNLQKPLKENYTDKDYISCQDNGFPHGETLLNKYIENQCKKISSYNI